MEAVDAITTDVAHKANGAYDYIKTHLAPFSYQRLSQESSSHSVLLDDDVGNGGKNESISNVQQTRTTSSYGLSWRWVAPAIMSVAVLLMCWATSVFVVSRPATVNPFIEARRNLKKEAFIDAVMANPVEGIVDLEPIRNRCRMSTPRPGLVWHCDYTSGGLGNLGNTWVGCMLFGIESGATTIILPSVGIRDDNNLINNGNRGNTTDMGILYDLDYFMDTWKEACPQIRVVRSDDEVPNLIGGHSLTPHKIPGLEVVRKTVVDSGSWRILFDDWLQRKTKPAEYANMSDKNPVRVVATGMLFAWHRASMDQQFAFAFTRMFRFRPDLRRLGASALWGLEQKVGRPIVSDAILFPELYADVYGPAPGRWSSWEVPPMGLTSSTPPTSAVNASIVTNLAPGRVLSHSFIGAHLRADSDATKLHWPGYDAQVPVYLHEAVTRNLSTIYLAAGTPESIVRFKKDAALYNLTVYTKEDVLGEDGAAEYETLTWDNRAVVDFQVLLHASYFTGFGQSTFSQTMAMRRSSMPDAGPNQMNPWRPFTNASFEIYRDHKSSVICGLHGQTLDMMFP